MSLRQSETDRIISTIRAGISARLSIMIVGNPGQGKSALVKAIADSMRYELITIVGSQRDSTDITGYPVKTDVVDSEGKHHTVGDYAIQKWQYTIMEHKRVVLFLDEFNNSPPPVQAAMLTLLNERMFPNGDALPAETVVIGAMNPVATSTNGFKLGLPVSNRLMMIPWDPTLSAWLDGFRTNWGHPIPKAEELWRNLIARFLERNPTMVYVLPDRKNASNPTVYGVTTDSEKEIFESAFPTNRSWTNLCRVIPYCTNDKGKVSPQIMLQAAEGLVGYDAAAKFVSFVKEWQVSRAKALPKVEDIIRHPDSVRWKTVDAAQGRRVISGAMKMASEDRGLVAPLVDMFVYVAEHRGTDLCAPYVTQLMQMASLQHLADGTKRLIAAYRDLGRNMSR